MKKILLSFVAAAATLAAGAQTVEASKFLDDWSFGVQGGVYEPTVGANMLNDMRAGVNIELQKQITPVFGIGANYFTGINANNANSKSLLFWGNGETPRTAFDFSNLSANALINLTNLFYGYKGEPRTMEVVARAGAGWGYILGDCYPQIGYEWSPRQMPEEVSLSEYYNTVTANFGLDFNFYCGESKAVAVNVKPAISFWEVGPGLNINKSYLSLMAGLTYHFKNSNGTHHFKLAEVRDQAEIDALNAQIAALRAELAKKPKEVVKEVVKEVPVTVETGKLAPVVIFRQGKSTIDAAQKPSVAMIAKYLQNHPNSKVVINGYASPEGPTALNQKLSEARAKAVCDMLVNTYKIDASRLTTKGLGETSEIFDENDWNRVAVFVEEGK